MGGGGGGRGRGRFPAPSSRSLAYVVCYLRFRLSVHLSVRPCFCLCACSPVVGRAACFLRLRPSASPPSSPSIKPSEFSLRGLLLELPLVRPPLCPSVFLSVRLFACRRPDRLFPSSAPVGLASFYLIATGSTNPGVRTEDLRAQTFYVTLPPRTCQVL